MVVAKRVVEGGKVKGAIEIASRFVVEKVRGRVWLKACGRKLEEGVVENECGRGVVENVVRLW